MFIVPGALLPSISEPCSVIPYFCLAKRPVKKYVRTLPLSQFLGVSDNTHRCSTSIQDAETFRVPARGTHGGVWGILVEDAMQILVALSEYLWCHDTRAGYNCQCDADAGIYSNCVAGSAVGSSPSSYLYPRCLRLLIQNLEGRHGPPSLYRHFSTRGSTHQC